MTVGGPLIQPSWAWARAVAAAATLAVVAWRIGAGPFRDGVRAVDGTTLAAAAAIGVLTTVCCAWRWTIVARGLGVHLSLPAAVAAYYRSMFLNLTLPGGVVGEPPRRQPRAWTARRRPRSAGRRVGAVVRQLVQVVLTVVVLFALPSPVQRWMPLAAAGLVAIAVGVFLVDRVLPGGGSSRLARVRTAVRSDIRDWLLARRALPAIALASVLVVLGHALTFVIAARAAGASAPPSRMLPLALLALLAMVLPGIDGWGPREGATAWVFGAAGLGADTGVATAVVYGVVVLAASLPGALVLVGAWLRHAGRLPVAGRRDGAVDA